MFFNINSLPLDVFNQAIPDWSFPLKEMISLLKSAWSELLWNF